MHIQHLDRPLTFVHLPKTAGTSITTFLSRYFEHEQISTKFYGDYKSLSKNVRFRSGHFRYHEVKQLQPSYFMTFLRHPIHRTLSQYKSWHDPNKLDPSWLNDPNIQHVRWVQHVSFDEFVMSDNAHILAAIENVQTSLLSEFPPNDRRFLSSAFQALEHGFLFVGIVERFEDSLDHLRACFEGIGAYTVPADAENRSVKMDIRPSDSAVTRILELNWADMALYRYAWGLLTERLRLKQVFVPQLDSL